MTSNGGIDKIPLFGLINLQHKNNMNESKVITMKEAVELFQRGKVVAVGEYRSSKPETIHYRDRESGKAAEFSQLRHTVEFNGESVQVSERVGDDFKPAEYRAPFKKGDMVLVELQSMEIVRGSISVRGVVHPVRG